MDSVDMLAHIARALGPLAEKVVFVGGSTVPFYLTDPGAMPALLVPRRERPGA